MFLLIENSAPAVSGSGLLFCFRSVWLFRIAVVSCCVRRDYRRIGQTAGTSPWSEKRPDRLMVKPRESALPTPSLY